MNEHDVAVTSELAMPVRTIDAISIAPAMPRAAVTSATGSLAAAAGSLAASASGSVAASVSASASASARASLAASESGSGSGSASGSGTERRHSEARTRSAHATGPQPRVANANASAHDHEHARGTIANSNHYSAGDLATSGMSDPLAVVLSTSRALFALTPGQPERAAREHRRTRRGKQRRSRSMTAPVQARLFDRR
jgi:hypothetical protein